MARALASVSANGVVSVHVLQAEEGTETTEAPSGETTATTVKDTSPLEIPPAELAWSLGSFVVLLILMRLVLYPRVSRGMTARADHITKSLADADGIRASSQADVKAYDAKLVEIRAEATAKIDAARATVEQERADAVADAGRRIADLRTVAAAEAAATRQSVSGSMVDAASDVVSAATRMLLGNAPDAGAVRTAVSQVMEGSS